ncbi:SpoIIE family protein phosphatase [Actinophytocola xanthii]|uniref:SpoIIE family protein phosphatase n=1 Tax=Actinophytocola xanthii TaxID=1912961 RepID=UPI0013015798|nr:SpoIIE family protein phosphatase [Actinophytocola xanthii]
MTSETDAGRRRMRTLGDLAQRIAGCTEVDQVGAVAASTLAADPADLPFAQVYLCQGADLRLVAVVPDSGIPATAPPALTEVLTEELPTTLPAGLFTDVAEPGARALALPLADGPDVLGVLVAGLNPHLELAGAYREFLDLLAAALAAGIQNAAAHQAGRQRIEVLEELDRAKTDLFANASHELRTPLTLVSAPAEEALADTDDPLPPAQRERIRLVRRNAARLRRLLNNILDFTRISGGGLRADLVATELAELTSAVAAAFAPAVERGGLRFNVDCPPLPRMVFVDREMWERIVLNLLSNALKFTLAGSITIRLAGDDDVVRLTVEDTGIGIPEDQIPLVFQRFHRVQGNVGRTREGAGIGLALVHELVGLHGGTVSLASEAGSGSTFEVRIPYGSGAMTSAAPEPAWVREVHLAEALGWMPDSPAPPVGPGAAAPVLVVEDNAELRGYLVRLLSPQWAVRSAADGEAALALAKAVKPALVLTDVGMPHMDGLALLNALREDPATQDVPIILLSAQAGAEATANALHAGADDYLVKPFSSVELLARVRSTIELARLRAHHSEREAVQARFATRLAGATDVGEVLAIAGEHLGASWRTSSVVVASWSATGHPTVVQGPTWEALPAHIREVLGELRRHVGPAVLARPADPLTGEGAGIGATVEVVGDDTAVWLELPATHAVTSADRDLLRALGAQLGLALSRARSYQQQRTVAVTLQRSILGPASPPGRGFAVRYEPAHRPLEVGGDWYDIVDLPDGGTGLVVGDCVGRGLPAAAVMGQLRSACRALLLQDTSPAQVLSVLDGFAGMLEGGLCTTVLCAYLSPTGTLTYSSAGHPPGILIDVDGVPTLLDRATSVPLAVRGRNPRREATVSLTPGSTLMLYTDGLVERSGVVIDTGIEAVVSVLAAGRRMPEEALVDRVLGAASSRIGSDDVAVLLYRHAAKGTARFARSFPADATELRPARLALQAWLAAREVDQDVVERAVLAAAEAWTNAAEHGYGLDRGCTVYTTATVHEGTLEIAVSDLGGWRTPGPPSNRGRGILLMKGLCDTVAIEATEEGTTVHLTLSTTAPNDEAKT